MLFHVVPARKEGTGRGYGPGWVVEAFNVALGAMRKPIRERERERDRHKKRDRLNPRGDETPDDLMTRSQWGTQRVFEVLAETFSLIEAAEWGSGWGREGEGRGRRKDRELIPFTGAVITSNWCVSGVADDVDEADVARGGGGERRGFTSYHQPVFPLRCRTLRRPHGTGYKLQR